MDKLLPCPFCNSNEVSISYGIQNNSEKTKHYYVECHLCACAGPESTLEINAIKSWNRRAEPVPNILERLQSIHDNVVRNYTKDALGELIQDLKESAHGEPVPEDKVCERCLGDGVHELQSLQGASEVDCQLCKGTGKEG